MIETKARPPALDQADASLRAERLPISNHDMLFAIICHRARWSMWSPNTRDTARWDIEIGLEEELKHAQRDSYRAASKHKMLGMLDTNPDAPRPQNPVMGFFIRREVAALHALNALRHATIQRRMVREMIATLRSQRRAAQNQEQRESYRSEWSLIATATVHDLRGRYRMRQRAWHEFQRLFAIYREACK